MNRTAKLGLLMAVVLTLGLLAGSLYLRGEPCLFCPWSYGHSRASEKMPLAKNFSFPTVGFWPWHSIVLYHDRAWLIKTAIFLGADPNAPFAEHHDLLPVGDRLLAYGITPLHVAAFYNSPVAIVALIENGANPNAPFAEYYYYTPLHTAAGRANANEAVAVLLEYGADPNARASSGFTPLHGAAITNSVQVAQTLLTWGADPCIRHRGLLPAETARQRGSKETEQLLLAHGADCA